MAIFWVIFWIRTASRRFHPGIGWKTIPPCRACRSFHSVLRGGNQTQKWHHDIMTSSKSASPFPTTSRQRSVWLWCRGTRVLEVPAGFDGGHVLRFSKVPHVFYLFWFCQIKYILIGIYYVYIYIYIWICNLWMVISQNGYNRYWCQESTSWLGDNTNMWGFTNVLTNQTDMIMASHVPNSNLFDITQW